MVVTRRRVSILRASHCQLAGPPCILYHVSVGRAVSGAWSEPSRGPQMTAWSVWTASGGHTSPSSPTQPVAQPEAWGSGWQLCTPLHCRVQKPRMDHLYLMVLFLGCAGEPCQAPGPGRMFLLWAAAYLPARSGGKLAWGFS